MQNNSRVICVGNIACDIIPEKATPDGEVLLTAYPGGSVFNTAIQMARLGLGVSLLSKTGTDFLSDVLMQHAKKEKIDTSYVVRNDGIRTALALAHINKKGDSSYIFYRTSGKESAFSNKEMPEDILENAAVLHTASGFSYADLTFENTLKLMERAARQKVFISYDPNWRAKRVKDVRKERRRIKKLISYVDLLKLSESDAIGITGARTLNNSLRKLPKNIFVTLGEKGSFFWTGEKRIFCPAFKVQVVDTIGAGDGFTAGLIYRYISSGKRSFSEKNEYEIKRDLAFASAVSGILCTGRGAMAELRNVRQVENFLKQQIKV